MMKRQAMVQIARIPTLALLPLFLVGCPDDEVTGTDNTGGGTGGGGTSGGGTGGGGTGGGGTGGGGTGGGDTGGGGTGGGDTGGGDTGGGDTGGGIEGFLDDTFEANLAYCEASVYCETGDYYSVDECLEARENYAYEYLADASQDCLDAYSDYLNCYASALTCDYDEYGYYAVYSDAYCDFEYAQVEANCY
ncbi:MAG: hypothetical protein KGO50_04690 [Myxococcales bacterium]|nr:hypothetical protein [Myxococcales bacterium]